ncbi:hypothetical protein [Pseudomonas lurida]|uniref:hypothetical protein n=1 Tax=Pseudomonas lurida TaxID=244566 RepID=UPI000F060DD7|nr:hypothetical protein [Pseudomonas lurida]
MFTMATALGLETGDRAEFVDMKDGQFSIIAASHTVQDLKGLIRKPAKASELIESLPPPRQASSAWFPS